MFTCPRCIKMNYHSVKKTYVYLLDTAIIYYWGVGFVSLHQWSQMRASAEENELESKLYLWLHLTPPSLKNIKKCFCYSKLSSCVFWKAFSPYTLYDHRLHNQGFSETRTSLSMGFSFPPEPLIGRQIRTGIVFLIRCSYGLLKKHRSSSV